MIFPLRLRNSGNCFFLTLGEEPSPNILQCIHSKKGLVDPTNGLLINTLYDVFKQHIPLAGIVRITM